MNNIFKGIVGQIISFLRKYYIVFVVFVPLGYIFADYEKFNGIKTLVKNALILGTDYNGEWWYVGFYLSVLFAFPFLDYIYKIPQVYGSKHRVSKIFCAGASIVVFTYLVAGIMQERIGYTVIFIEGYTFFKFKVFERVSKRMKSGIINTLFAAIVLLASIVIRFLVTPRAGYYTIDILIIAPFVYGCVNLVRQSKILKSFFAFFGKHSTYMWLTHTFFAYYIFQDFIMVSKIDLVMYIQLIVVSLVASYLLLKIEKIIFYVLKKGISRLETNR